MDKLGPRFEFQATVPATGQAVAVHAITRHEFSVNDDSGTNRVTDTTPRRRREFAAHNGMICVGVQGRPHATTRRKYSAIGADSLGSNARSAAHPP
jgi:hypothetical protein